MKRKWPFSFSSLFKPYTRSSFKDSAQIARTVGAKESGVSESPGVFDFTLSLPLSFGFV
jgi:hypothetical protein